MTTRRPSSRSSSSGPTHLVVGSLGRAVGLKGEVEIRITSDDPHRFEPGATVYAESDGRPLTVRRLRRHRNRRIISFEEVGDRTAAEALRGEVLVVKASDARELQEDEFWLHELIGCEVFTLDGARIGEVGDVLEAGESDVLVVAAEGREHLVPFAEDLCPEVDLDAGRIVVRPIPGLLD